MNNFKLPIIIIAVFIFGSVVNAGVDSVSTKLSAERQNTNYLATVVEVQTIETTELNKVENFAVDFYRTISGLFKRTDEAGSLRFAREDESKKGIRDEVSPSETSSTDFAEQNPSRISFGDSSQRGVERSGTTSLSSDDRTEGTSQRAVASLSSNDDSEAVQKTTIINPIQERTIETVIERTVSGVTLADLQALNNELRSEIYRVSNNSTTQTQNNYRAIALTNKIDQLTSVTINDSTITGGTITGATFSGSTLSLTGTVSAGSGTFSGGVSGTTGSFSDNLTTSGQLTVSGTATSTMAGDFAFDTNTLYIDSLNNRVGIGSTSPSDTLSINGATYLAPISTPSVTTDRLYNVSNDLYWAGNLIGGATTANWTLSGGNAYRTTGNVGVGTTSPYAKLSVVGTVVAKNFVATSTTATSTFAGGLAVGTSNFVVDRSTGYVGVGTASPTSKLDVDGNINIRNGNFVLNQITAPLTPTVAVNVAAGNLNGSYEYVITFVTANGETEAGARSSFVNPSNQQVDLSGIPVSSDSSVTARKIYRQPTGAADSVLKQLVATINDNTTTTYTDNIADGSLGVAVPRINTTGGSIYNGSTRIAVSDPSTTSFGFDSLVNNTGYANVSFGGGSLKDNTTGYRNSAFGLFSMYKNTTGINNSAFGTHALNDNLTGGNNSAFGYGSLMGNTASDNSAFGSYSLYTNTTGDSNSAFGEYSLQFNTSGANNSAFGKYSLNSNTEGALNTAIGINAGYSNTTGNFNTSVGAQSLNNVTTNSGNTAVGFQSLYTSDSYNNTAVGYQAGYGLTTGGNNLVLGYSAGNNLTTGLNNIVIGYDIDSPTATNSNTMTIGNLIYGTGIDGTGTTLSSGNIGIGLSAPGARLHSLSLTEQFRLGYDVSTYSSFILDILGDLTIDPTGTEVTFPDQNLNICSGDACQTTALNSGNGNLTVENNIEIGGSYNRTCATGYIWVPGSAKFGTLPGFCVMKYEAKNDGSNNAVSTATGNPYVSIDQPTARTKCEAIGLGYHLISEPEWMTIAENIAQTPINDMDADDGLQLATGHADNSPTNALATTAASDPVVSGCNLSVTMENAANAYSAASCEIQGDGSYTGDDNDKGFYGTEQNWSTTGYSSGVANKSQLRTHILSNGNVIWDMGGNVWEWTDAYINGTAEKPTAVTDSWQEYSAITNYLGLNYARPQNPSWSSANGIGEYLAATTEGQRAFRRGGNWAGAEASGVFALILNYAPAGSSTYLGFRCSR